MAQIQQYIDLITQNLIELEQLINKSSLFNNDQKKWKSNCIGVATDINNNILLMQDQVKDLPSSQASQYVGSIKSFKKKLQKLKNDIDKRERKISDMSEVPVRTPIIQTPEEKRMNAIMEVMNKGDEAQERTKGALVQMHKIYERGIELANDINTELNKQIEQLDRMNEKVKDTESTLKKAQKNILYFARAMECDKCMVGLLIMILLALVAVIVMAVKKNGG